MITPGESAIGVNGKSVWHVDFESSTARLQKTNIKHIRKTNWQLAVYYSAHANNINNNPTYLFSSFIIFYSRAFVGDEFMTPLVHNTDADLALVTLLTQPPNEIATVGAKCDISWIMFWSIQFSFFKIFPLDAVNRLSTEWSSGRGRVVGAASRQ